MQFATPQDKQAFIKNVKEISDSLSRVQGENELQSEIIAQAKEKYGKENAAVMKNIAKIYFKQNLAEAEEKALEPIEGYKELFES